MTLSDFPYDQLVAPTFSLSGRRALITGAAGHLGRAMAKGLAQAGAHVLMVGRNLDTLGAVLEDIKSAGGQGECHQLDLRDDAALAGFTRDLSDGDAPLDILVNNAYGGPTNTLAASTPDEFRKSYDIGMVAAAELVRGLTPALKRGVSVNGDASVVNIASMYGHSSPDPAIYGTSGQNSPPFYGAVKGALLQYTRYAAVHLAADRIRVNAISPGPVPPLTFREQKPDFYQELRAKVPMGRIGVSDDMIGPLVFLSSPASQFVTGTNLCVDGGWTVW